MLIVPSPYSPFRRKVAAIIFVVLLLLLGGSALLLALQLDPARVWNSLRSGAFTTNSESRIVNIGVCPTRCRSINDVQTVRVYDGVTDLTTCNTLSGEFRFIEQNQFPENIQKVNTGQPRAICVAK